MLMEHKTIFRMQFSNKEFEALEKVCAIMNSIYWESCDCKGNTYDMIDAENGVVLATHEQMCHTLDMLNTLCALHEDNNGFGFNIEYV